jgi:hypothetical protein
MTLNLISLVLTIVYRLIGSLLTSYMIQDHLPLLIEKTGYTKTRSESGTLISLNGDKEFKKGFVFSNGFYQIFLVVNYPMKDGRLIRSRVNLTLCKSIHTLAA